MFVRSVAFCSRQPQGVCGQHIGQDNPPIRRWFQESLEEECPSSCYSTQLVSTVRTPAEALNRSDLTYFEISMSKFSFLDITQIRKMDQYALIAGVGGTLGLWMGVSLLNFVEFVIDIFSIVFVN